MKILKIIQIIAIILVLIALPLAFGYYQGTKTQEAKPDNSVASPMAGVAIGGPYTLIDQDGQVRTDEDFKGEYKLIYFGFSYCPAICPTELQKMTAVMAQLTPELAAQIQPIFISVDPERDTPESLKGYMILFHERFIGLTGTSEQIDAVKKAYRVYSRKVQDETMSDYTVDHSSYIYFMGPDDQLLGMYRIKDTPMDITKDIMGLMKD